MSSRVKLPLNTAMHYLQMMNKISEPTDFGKDKPT